MKTAAIILATLGLAIAGAAAASDHLTDVDYLKVNRCAGIAEGLGSSDAASLNALVKTEGRSRVETIYAKGQEEEARAKKAASSTDSKERLSAELSGPCMAYLGGGGSTASAVAAGKNASTSH
jgi:hypothetical protein